MRNYWYQIKNFLEIPFDPLNEKTYKRAIVSGLLNIFILMVGLHSIPYALARGLSSPQAILALVDFLILIIARFALNKGYVQAVSLTLLIIFWITVFVVFHWFENGLRAPTYAATLAFLIVYAAVLHGPKVAWGFVVTNIVLNVFIALRETNGYFLTQPKTPDVRWVVWGQVVFFPTITYVINKSLRNLTESIGLYRAESEKRLSAEINVRQLHEELEKAYESTLKGWANALELRDKETVGHCRRVSDLSVELGRKLELGGDELKFIYYGALLHDIGKMGIPDEILNKTDPLSPQEWEVVRLHPIHAYNLLKDIPYLQKALHIPYCHHEKWDGTGYPRKLKGEEIPLPARIFTVADHWDALKSDRPYREAWPREKVLTYIKEQSGKIFDPHVVEEFLEIINDDIILTTE